MPAVDISNKEPLRQSLVANDTFTAGDFPVTIIEAQGSNGIFTGTGFIQVPYLADTKIKVAFQNIAINSDKKLISGTVETEYDPNESAVHFASTGLGELFGDAGIKDITLDYNVSNVQFIATPPPGKIIIIGDNGKENNDDKGSATGSTQELPAGRDYTIVDKNGNVWSVDEDGNITQKEKQIDEILNNSTSDTKNNQIKFIYEDNEYDNKSLIYKVLDEEDLSISILSSNNPDLIKGELTWFFDKKEVAKGTDLTKIKIPITTLKNKTYTLSLNNGKEEIASIKVEFFKTPMITFSLSDEYNGDFMFDNEFTKNRNVIRDYQKLSTFNDYYIPILAVETGKTAKLKVNITGLPRNIVNMKDFKITLIGENTQSILINDRNIFEINSKNLQNTLSIELKSSNIDFNTPLYLNAIYKNKIIGKIKIYSTTPIEKRVQLVFVKLGGEGYRNLDMNKFEQYLNNKSLNQLFTKIKLEPKKELDLSTSNNENLKNTIERNIQNYTSSNVEGRAIIDSLINKYKTTYSYNGNSIDLFFIINKQITTTNDGELGGIHKTGDIGGALFVYTDDPYEATAHELGHWLGLKHTWDEGTPTKIPQANTQNNFMDYNIKRKSWFEFQLKKVYRTLK